MGTTIRNDGRPHFGNLPLPTQPLNSAVSDAPFVDKRAAIGKHSLLVLNREVIEEERWGEGVILSRGSQLFEVAKRIWPLPTAST
jgi:hypothetical protein